MIRDNTFTVGEKDAGCRLDMLLLATFPGSSRAFCRQALEQGLVLHNGCPAQKGHKAVAGDRIEVRALKEEIDNRVSPDTSVPLEILFEDAHLVAANKPSGMAVHPLSSDERGTLMNGLVARHPEMASVGDRPLMAGALHRIDTGTSGLVLAARTASAFEKLRGQFVAQSVRKVYLALVEGHVAVPGHLEHELAHDPHLPHCKMADAAKLSGARRRMRAVTAYRPLELVSRYTLMEVVIHTGVTHQIRCQLALAGWPVVNDTLYGAHPVMGSGRHMLHAAEIEFEHPASGACCRLQAPPAADFQAFMRAAGGVS
ncbi:MAG: RluA family pseudouridine synthase [Kiritimatiellae bacterium]|nr:RluA family pseudouridine synthase [Kiritimatiellia bacterium]